MAIACAYCDGSHDTAAEVRRCWEGVGQPDVPSDHGVAPPDHEADPHDDGARVAPARADTGQSAPTRAPSAGPTLVRGVAVASAGPDELGRCVAVAPDALLPEPWQGAERLRLDATTMAEPAFALAAIRGAHHERRRLILEIDADIDREPLLMTDAEPFQVGPRFSFEREELHHAIWSNTVDLRSDRPVWVGLDRAIALGAVVQVDGPGDVVTPDGTPVWLDGGPLRHTDPVGGTAVLPVVSVEHGSFAPPGPNVCHADLAADQLAAVTHAGGAARIIAPAGSGKTRVLTERARHLLRTWNLPASAVSLVAFNKRAQEEMVERTPDLPGLQVRTLNAIALAIVNGTPPFLSQPTRWNTIGEPDVRRIIGDLVAFPKRRNSDPVAPWIEALSLVRLGLVPPEDAEERYDGDVEGLAAVWPAYRAALERRRAVDFDDQIHRALLVLLSQPHARRAAQRACRVMLVDEFQDLTPAHLLLIRLLAAPGGAVFGVGDDDQTIYGYNGADPGWLIDFADLFPGAGAHPLEVNYRCPAGIVDVADRLLRHNVRRVAKTIRPGPHHEDPAVTGWSVDESTDPVDATRRAVEGALRDGATAGDVAVLTRVNALLAPVQVALSVQGIPVSGGVGLEFADRTAIRSVLSWLRLATRDRWVPDDVREALRRPSRSFHPRINDWVCEQGSVVDLHRLAARLNNERDQERVTDFAVDIARLQQLVANAAPTSDIVFVLIDEIGLAGAVGTLDVHRRGMNRAAQSDDLTAITHLAALHDDATSFEAWLRDHLALRRDPGGVTLSTVHRVKGQEWPHVVVHLADADQYPHRLAEDTEEERRLFHVALTRAGRHVTVTTGPNPSPFVAELTNEPPERSERPEPPVISSRRSRAAGGSAASRSPSSSKDPVDDLDDDARQRFAALRDLRNDLRDGKPAYVVFDNKTLVMIARLAPTTRRDLAKVSGVGPAKLDKYGDAVIELMQSLT